ncbi:histone-lysine N-methyltransferase SMYD3-like [Carassius auratus]|uniref:Histone-lysine N-methyltransferase SMYD3-like n=1 Tax=Carassius auratus TaxID=7957 RepID=A0A6P6R7C2_CARAU|nr:histone-lysine N-methyltransferase SMYD3-like [Carassius auratus]
MAGSPPTRLVERIFFKLLSQSESDQEELYSIAEQESHNCLAYMNEEKKEGLRHLSTTLQVYLSEENHDLSLFPPGLDPISLLARVTCNCFGISDGELQVVGVGLYPRRLTISYTDILATSKERRSQVWEELLQESQALLHRYADVIPGRNFYVLRLLNLAMDACISLDDYEYSNRALESYKFYFSDPHLFRAVELLWVGKLQHYLSRLEEAQGSFTQAYDIMKVTHGTACTQTNEVRRKLSKCQTELGRV